MRLVSLLMLLCVETAAHAHVGGQPTNATFSTPAAPITAAADLDVVLQPHTFATADASFLVSWSDGDMDPSGRYTFYVMDRQPNTAVTVEDIEQGAGTPAREVGKPNDPVSIWNSCSCAEDAGVVCPDAGTRDCRNAFMWDTSGLAAGSYWLVAINDDPPFKLYNPTSAPVRVAHAGAELPPAVIVLRPDGFGAFDKNYRAQWYAVGKAPLKIDLLYGSGDEGKAGGPLTQLANNVMAPIAADGTQSFDWDVSKLVSLHLYFLRVRVTDGDGRVVISDSRYSLSVFHPSTAVDMSAAQPVDAGEPPRMDGGGCACDLGAAAPVATPLFIGLAFVWLLASCRRCRR
jgi:hypothetical protein